jgi:hypothetical protein
MKQVFILLFLICQIFKFWSQSIPNEIIAKKKIELNLNKTEDLKTLSDWVMDYLQFKENKKKANGFYYFETHNYNYRYYPLINTFSDTLVPVLFKYYKFNDVTPKTLALLDMPQSIKDSVLTSKDLDDFIRARLGDTIAENKIIKEFHKLNKKNIDSKDQQEALWELALNLLYINSMKTIKTFIKGMESNKIDMVYQEYNQQEGNMFISRFNAFLGIYHSYYPYEYITSPWYNKRFWQLKTRTEEMALYFKEIEGFFKNKYDVSININTSVMGYGYLEIKEDQITND